MMTTVLCCQIGLLLSQRNMRKQLSLYQSTDVFSTRDLVVVLSSIESVKNFKPDYEKVTRMKDHHALMVTAQDGINWLCTQVFCPHWY